MVSYQTCQIFYMKPPAFESDLLQSALAFHLHAIKQRRSCWPLGAFHEGSFTAGFQLDGNSPSRMQISGHEDSQRKFAVSYQPTYLPELLTSCVSTCLFINVFTLDECVILSRLFISLLVLPHNQHKCATKNEKSAVRLG